MSKQSEAVLEENLIRQLSGELGYEKVIIKDESDLLSNLKSQLEKHNKTTISSNRI
jgi:type I restriction enzyme, R subunit